MSDALAQTGSVRCRSTDVWCHGSVRSMSIWYEPRNNIAKRWFTWMPACSGPLTAIARRLRSAPVKSFQIQCVGDSLSCGSAPRFSGVRVRQQAPRPGQCSRMSANVLRAPRLCEVPVVQRVFPHNENRGTRLGPRWSNKAQALQNHQSKGTPERVRESLLGGEAR